MKLPDLSVAADAGVHEWAGAPDVSYFGATNQSINRKFPLPRIRFLQVALRP